MHEMPSNILRTENSYLSIFVIIDKIKNFKPLHFILMVCTFFSFEKIASAINWILIILPASISFSHLPVDTLSVNSRLWLNPFLPRLNW